MEDNVERPEQTGAPATITVSGSGAVRELTLNRPDRHNAQNLTMWREITEVVYKLSADPDVAVLVMRGCGRSFSSGIDLSEFSRPGGFIRSLGEYRSGAPDPMLASIHEAQRVVVALREAPFVTIAELRGAVLGAGLQLALACDVRIAATDARLALLECTKQMIPDLGGIWSLARLVGRERALDLIVTGRELNGKEAAEQGVVLKAVSAEDLPQAVRAYATSIASTSRTAVAFVKASLDARDEQSSLAMAAVGQAACVRGIAADLN
jgi:enoyl-CoA hydratase/carnithine racemase